MDKLPIGIWLTKKSMSKSPERAVEGLELLEAKTIVVPNSDKWVDYSHDAIRRWGVESVSITESGLVGFNLDNDEHFAMLVESTGPSRIEYQYINRHKKTLSPRRNSVSPPAHAKRFSPLISDKYHIYADPGLYAGLRIYGPDMTTLNIIFSVLDLNDYLF